MLVPVGLSSQTGQIPQRNFPGFCFEAGGLCLAISLLGGESGKKARGEVWEGKGRAKHSICNHSIPWEGLPRLHFPWSLASSSGKFLLMHSPPWSHLKWTLKR